MLVGWSSYACILHAPLRSAVPRESSADDGHPRLAFVLPAVAGTAPPPPIGLTTSDGSALTLTALTAHTRLVGPLAETELLVSFSNPEWRQREGRFRVVLPRGAFLSRLAMKVDGVFREADVAELARAREVYEEVLHARRDPLLVEQHGDEELSARVFPIAGGERKDIIVAWTASATAESPVTIPLRGLPEIGALDVLVTEGANELVVQHAEHVTPLADVVVPLPAAAAVRSGNVLVARVTIPAGGGAAATFDRGTVVLVDTSASRAPDLAKQVSLVSELVGELKARAPAAPLSVAAFDQAVVPLPLADLEARLRAHGALGASDLERALVWAGEEARRTGASRVLMVGDGLATAGSADPQRLRGVVRAMGAAGVERLDIVAQGELRGDATMRALAIGVLPRDGILALGTQPAAEIVRRLALPARSQVQVGMPGATWQWPTSFDGVQPGDERYVIAELPAGAPAVVHVDGHATLLDATMAPAPLLARVLAKAKVDALVARGEARGFDAPLRARIVALARKHRVPSPFTAFLVTESEADRAALLRPPPPPVVTATPARRSVATPVAPGWGRVRLSGSHVAKPVAIRMATSTVNGRLPPQSVQQVVRQSSGRFRGCYEISLLQHGQREGRVVTKFLIDVDGSVRWAVDGGSDIDDPSLVACIVEAFRELHFARPEGGVVTVVYPLVLQPLPFDGSRAEALAEQREAGRAAFFAFSPFAAPRSPPPPPAPWFGAYADTRAALAFADPRRALGIAADAHARDGRDVVALVALGEALEAAQLTELAARAFGSIADQHPHDADMLRVAAGRLEALGPETLPLAIELWRRAKDDRPDQPGAHHALALALLRAGARDEAVRTLDAALEISFAARYGDAHELLRQTRRDLADAAAPASVRFVLGWETDASDLDLRTPAGTYPRRVSDGYGPEALLVTGARGERAATSVRVALVRRGPTRLPMGVVHVMEHDGRGHVTVITRPFVLMNEGAQIDLGTFD